MPEPVSRLTLQLLDWVASRPRTYAEAMDAWRTSCPQLSIWEDALIDGLIQVNRRESMRQGQVELTLRGRAILDASQASGPV
jgi:hypothetical protein